MATAPRPPPAARARLGVQAVEGGNVVVPLDRASRRAPKRRTAARVQLPHLVAHRVVVRVEQVGAVVGVAGEVELDDALDRHAGEVVARVEAVVEGADEDVVDVEQDAAVGALRDARRGTPTRSSSSR